VSDSGFGNIEKDFLLMKNSNGNPKCCKVDKFGAFFILDSQITNIQLVCILSSLILETSFFMMSYCHLLPFSGLQIRVVDHF
jgi:hypothetical protein